MTKEIVRDAESEISQRIAFLDLPFFERIRKVESKEPDMWPMYEAFLTRVDSLLHSFRSAGAELAIRGGELETPWLDPGSEIKDWETSLAIWDLEWPFPCVIHEEQIIPVLFNPESYGIYGTAKLGFLDLVVTNSPLSNALEENQLAFFDSFLADPWSAGKETGWMNVQEFPMDRNAFLNGFHPSLAVGYDHFRPRHRLKALLTPIEELRALQQIRLICSSEAIGLKPEADLSSDITADLFEMREIDMAGITVTMWSHPRNYRQHGFNLDKVKAALSKDEGSGSWFVELPTTTIDIIDYDPEDLAWWEKQIDGLEQEDPEAIRAAHFFVESLCRAVRKIIRYDLNMFPETTLERIRGIVERVKTIWKAHPPTQTLLKIMETDLNSAHYWVGQHLRDILQRQGYLGSDIIRDMGLSGIVQFDYDAGRYKITGQ